MNLVCDSYCQKLRSFRIHTPGGGEIVKPGNISAVVCPEAPFAFAGGNPFRAVFRK
jgi:hypothetical protein